MLLVCPFIPAFYLSNSSNSIIVLIHWRSRQICCFYFMKFAIAELLLEVEHLLLKIGYQMALMMLQLQRPM